MIAQASSILNAGPLLSPWFVIPLSIFALLVIAAHVLTLDQAEMPASRKRIRRVNGLLMMFTVPLVAYAFGIATPARPRVFVMVWMIVAGLVMLVLSLALLDVVNTWRVTRRQRRELRKQIASAREAATLLKGRS